MTLLLEVDLDSSVPVYEQIRAQVSGHVAAGRLCPGDRLPTIRDLASDLGLAAGTVARAYRELELAGIVVTRRRIGTVVADGVVVTDEPARRAAARFVAAARATGLTDEAILDLVRGTLAAPGDPA